MRCRPEMSSRSNQFRIGDTISIIYNGRITLGAINDYYPDQSTYNLMIETEEDKFEEIIVNETEIRTDNNTPYENAVHRRYKKGDAVWIIRSDGEFQIWIVIHYLDGYRYTVRPSKDDRTMYRPETEKDLHKINSQYDLSHLTKKIEALHFHYNNIQVSEILFNPNKDILNGILYLLNHLIEDINNEPFKDNCPGLLFYLNYFESLRHELYKAKKEKQKSETTLSELYPQGIDSDLKQGNRGTCYLLAALKALKLNKKLFELMLRRTIKKNDNQSWTIQFLGSENEQEPKNITNTKLQFWKKYISNMRSAQGDKLLELAYASYLNSKPVETIQTNTNKKSTMFLDDNGKNVVDGGYAHRTLADLLGPIAVKHMRVPHGKAWNHGTFEKENDHSTIYNFFNYEYPSIKDESVITASSENSKNGDRDNIIINGHKFAKQHAYTIVDFNPYTQEIYISNPHNSKVTLILNIQQFNSVFKDLKLIKIDKLAKAMIEAQKIEKMTIYERIMNEILNSDNDIFSLTNTNNAEHLRDQLLYTYHYIKNPAQQEIFKNYVNYYLRVQNINFQI